MYANRYPITLRMALREIVTVSAGIWRQYRADARTRAARLRQARALARAYAPRRRRGFDELDSLAWLAVIALGLAVVGITLADGWPALAHWWAQATAAVLGGSKAAAAGAAWVSTRGHHSRHLSAPTQALLACLEQHPGLTCDQLADRLSLSRSLARRRLALLMDSGWVTGTHAPEADADRVHRVEWRVIARRVSLPPPRADEPARPVVPPRRPDHSQPWTQPYLSSAGQRQGSQDFRALPSLLGSQARAYEPRP